MKKVALIVVFAIFFSGCAGISRMQRQALDNAVRELNQVTHESFEMNHLPKNHSVPLPVQPKPVLRRFQPKPTAIVPQPVPVKPYAVPKYSYTAPEKDVDKVPLYPLPFPFPEIPDIDSPEPVYNIQGQRYKVVPNPVLPGQRLGGAGWIIVPVE